MKLAGLALGVLVFAAMLALPAPEGLSPAGWRVAALFAWMVIWWLTEAVPLPVPAFLPFIVLPLLGVAEIDAVARAYASPLLALVFAGGLIALAAAKTGLHRRLALLAVRLGGDGGRSLILALMLATGFLGMWMATSVAALFMMEIALVLIAAATGPAAPAAEARRFACAAIIGVSYSAAFGSFSTLTGNPVNAAGAAMIKRLIGLEVSFAQWLTFGLPIGVLGILASWAVLVGLAFPFRLQLAPKAQLAASLKVEGPLSAAEVRVLTIASMTVLGLISLPLIRAVSPAASDAAVSLVGALLLFVIPAGTAKGERLLDWEDTRRAPWGVLVIVGGAMAISTVLTDTGLAAWLASPLKGLAGAPPWLAVLGLVVGACLLTELINNFAAMAIAVAGATALASAIGVDPAPLAIAATIAVAGGFIFPGPPFLALAAATPPVRLADLARSGVWMLVLAPLIIAGVCLAVGGLLAPG